MPKTAKIGTKHKSSYVSDKVFLNIPYDKRNSTWRTFAPWRLRFLESDGPIHIGSAIGLCERSFVFRTLEARSVIERGKEQNKKMLEIDVGSRNVIENTRKDDILSCYLSDILGSSELVLTEYAPFGATKVTFSMLPNRQCTALAMPRFEPQG